MNAYPQNFLFNKGIFKALEQKAALMKLTLARASRPEHSSRTIPDHGPPQTGHLTVLNSNLSESLDSPFDSMSQLFSLRTPSWKQMYIFSTISSLQQSDRFDLWLRWERRRPSRAKKPSGSSHLQWSWFCLNQIPEKDETFQSSFHQKSCSLQILYYLDAFC